MISSDFLGSHGGEDVDVLLGSDATSSHVVTTHKIFDIF
jgi:hypothetical protein